MVFAMRLNTVLCCVINNIHHCKTTNIHLKGSEKIDE